MAKRKQIEVDCVDSVTCLNLLTAVLFLGRKDTIAN